jgi:hypothetical protein
MMLMVWEAYLDNNNVAQEINGYDEQEVEMAMHQAQLTSYGDFEDYDPFGHVDADGNDINMSQAKEDITPDDSEALTKQAKQVGQSVDTAYKENAEMEVEHDNLNADASLTMEQKYPKFGWNLDTTQRDDELQITCPDGEDPTIYGSISISSATSPLRRGASQEEEAQAKSRKPMRFTIPPSWWDPCVWWLRQCEWTKSGHCIKGVKNGHICTWMEMSLALQIQTGIRLAPTILDMRSQEHAFKRMVRAIWSRAKCMQGGRYVTCKQTWGFAAYITSLVPVIGYSRAGICRRPMLNNGIWKLVATICENANLQGRCASTFGKYIRTVIPNNSLSSWKATASLTKTSATATWRCQYRRYKEMVAISDIQRRRHECEAR